MMLQCRQSSSKHLLDLDHLRTWRLSPLTRPRRSGPKPAALHQLANSAFRLPAGACCAQSRVHILSLARSFASPCKGPGDLEPLPLSDAQRRTIYALSTAPGKAGVAVIRISGPDALHVWRGMVEAGKGKAREVDPEPWRMYRCRLVHPISGDLLDDGLAVYFKSPRSFTTEDVLELHIHSGRAIISSVLSALSQFPICRPAEPGEFTRRAFEGGRLDLTQVEGLKDLIDAETESQRRAALLAAGGVSRHRFEQLRTDIIQCLALVEALIDFGEGEDIEEGVYDQARERITNLIQSIRGNLSDNRKGEIMRSGIRLAIFGPPNAGKSSLLNFLAQREAAIVTPVPGTTRDILELSLDIGGLPVLVSDTAGIRKSDDVVERIGVERAGQLVKAADVSLCVLSLPEIMKTAAEQHNLPMTVPAAITTLVNGNTYLLLNKVDMLDVSPGTVEAIRAAVGATRAWVVSLTTSVGTQAFVESFAQALRERYDILQGRGSGDEPLITHARHRVHLENALRFLEASLEYPPEDVVLAAEELRYAAQAVGKISGLIDVEDVLDAVFRDFCIGK